MVLPPDALCQEGYFKACVKYVEDRRQAQAEGRNPELVDFFLPATDEDDLGDRRSCLLMVGLRLLMVKAMRMRRMETVMMMRIWTFDV